MTGFGRGLAGAEEEEILVELSSVNHRYCEVSCRLPQPLNSFEAEIKKAIQASVGRGRVTIYATMRSGTRSGGAVALDPILTGKFIESVRSVSAQLGLKDDVAMSDLVGVSSLIVAVPDDVDEEGRKAVLLDAVGRAVEALNEMRSNEGAQLKTELTDRLASIAGTVDRIEKHVPEIRENYESRMRERLKDICADINVAEDRVAMEVAIMAEKSDITEEIVRLRSHFEQFSELMEKNDGSGRSLDFLIQEMNREVNTIGSKCRDVACSRFVVDLKSELEKLREQAQNVE
ncbi:YicC/YloC family endoribonuclease [Candidatus Hydrogenedentota bacterium]